MNNLLTINKGEKMPKQIDPKKQYIINDSLWITRAEQVDKLQWTYGDDCKWPHGIRMIPSTKTGLLNMMMGIEARINPGVTRTGDAMLKFAADKAQKVGFPKPAGLAKRYTWHWLNEGLIKEVA